MVWVGFGLWLNAQLPLPPCISYVRNHDYHAAALKERECLVAGTTAQGCFFRKGAMIGPAFRSRERNPIKE
jgi:hypothetical protein